MIELQIKESKRKKLRSYALGGSVKNYAAAVKAAIGRGYIELRPSGAYVTFTQAGADLFA
jgi:hypothetical protein